jgi:hypothetical protein
MNEKCARGDRNSSRNVEGLGSETARATSVIQLQHRHLESHISDAVLQSPVTYAVAAGKHVTRFEFRKFATDRPAVARAAVLTIRSSVIGHPAVAPSPLT